MQGFQTNSVSVPPNAVDGQVVPPTGTGGWGRDCAPGIAGTKVGADESNDLLGNILRVLQAARISPTANRYDDLIDALDKLYRGPSSDDGNVLLVGVDGKPLLTVDPTDGNLLKSRTGGLFVEVAAQEVTGLAKVATSGNFDDLDGAPEAYVLPAATHDALGGVIAGPGTDVDAIGKLSVKPTLIVNITASANVALDLSPISGGAPEILFNLPVAASSTTTISIVNPPTAGVLAAIVLIVANNAGSVIVWPSSLRWPQGIVPALSGVAGKLDTFVIYTQDGGHTYDGFVAGQNI